MRRLPVFFVLDCSESMVGDNLRKMEDGIKAIVRNLRTDPQALETVAISVIAFAGIARTIAPLVEVATFYTPKLPLGGGTSLGAALDTLMAEIDKSVVKTTVDQKGDWKPIVYLFTDGRPTDDPLPAISKWHSKYSSKATMIAVGLGADSDFKILKRVTENVIIFEDSQVGDFDKFVRWVSASVVVQSKSVGESVERLVFPDLDESVMKKFDESSRSLADEACVTLVGRCQKSHKPYIIKYDREKHNLRSLDFKLQVSNYVLSGCYPLEEDYFSWTDMRAGEFKVNSEDLSGSPGCPHCGNFTAFAVCSCGKLMCINGPEHATCPWCEQSVSFSPSTSDDEGGFDVGRGRG